VSYNPGTYHVLVRVTADNANETSALGTLEALRPARLEVNAYVNMTPSTGDYFKISVKVHNKGDTSAEEVIISIDLSLAEGLRLIPLEESVRKLGKIGGGSFEHCGWYLQAVKPGVYPVKVKATSLNAGEDYVIVLVNVVSKG